MNVVLRRVALGVLVTLLCHGQGNALDVEHIVFEAGSIGESGSPAASGWEFIPTNTPDPGTFGATTAIEAVPNRTFQTGTNSEALVMHPWYFDNTGSFNHGAEWYAANDAGAEMQTVDAGEILYIQMEIFADFAGGGQWFKLGSAVGLRGNGDETRGFNNEGVLGDIGREMRTSVEADWTFDEELNFNGQIRGSDKAQKQNSTNFANPPTADDLDKTYLSTAVFRQGGDAATPFVGTETEVSGALDSKNGGDSSHGGDGVPTAPWGGNSNEITGLVIDRAQVNILRGSNNLPGSQPSRISVTSNFVDENELDENSPQYISNAVLGIKMFRYGITDMTDVNLDGVTDSLDRAIVEANLGATVDQDGLNGPTFYEGDIDNDLDVDEVDLAYFDDLTVDADLNMDGFVDGLDLGILLGEWNPQVAAAMGITPGGAVPEPTSLVLLMVAGTGLLATRRRIRS